MMALPNEKPASAVYDKGRRGEPLPGCDCVQCFGYCVVDGDEAERQRFANQVPHGAREE
jgi:hypothetical protein